MELQVKNGTSITLDEKVFEKEFNEALIHQVVVSYQLSGRMGTKAQKTRAEVSGGGIKPWRQKGTGRARAGSIRSPIWRSGGVTFAAKPKNWQQKINRKMYRAAISSIFSELIRKESLIVVESFNIENPKTKDGLKMLSDMGLGNNVLLVTEAIDLNLYLSVRNVPNIGLIDMAGINPVSLIQFEKVAITRDALVAVGEWLL